jgi:hypothetical protein
LAIKLDEKHEGDGSPPGTNPSSGVWRLIEVIRNAERVDPTGKLHLTAWQAPYGASCGPVTA